MKLVPKEQPRESASTWIWIIAVAMTLGVVLCAAIASRAQTADAPKVILCPRQAVVNGTTVTVTATSRCRMKFKLPPGFNAMVARNKANGATIVRVDCPSPACVNVADGVEVEVQVPYVIGLPGMADPLNGELVGFRPATENDNPSIVHVSNAAEFVETLPQGFYTPAITVAQFIQAFVGF